MMAGIATIALILVTVVVSWQAFNNPRLMDRLILWPPAIDRWKQYDRLVGHGFVHADMQHLVFNMITLFFFGRMIEQVFAGRIGTIGFVLFYLSAILVSALPAYLRHRRDTRYRSLGASGGVTALVFAFILFDPWSRIFIPIPVPAILYAVGYVAYSFWAGRRGRDNVDHSAHLWGAGYGVLFTVMLEPRVIGFFLSRLASPRWPF